MYTDEKNARMHLRKLDNQLKHEFSLYCHQQRLTLHDAVERLMKLVVEGKINLQGDKND